MVLKSIRIILGYTIVAINVCFPPRRIRRSADEQSRIDAKVKGLILYEFYLCPFCVRVRRTMTHLNIKIARRDAKRNQSYEQELIKGGGKQKVPCLRIEKEGKVSWLYESLKINQYLTELAH